MCSGNLRFINREVVYKKSKLSKPMFMSITGVAIEFIPYNLIFCYFIW